MFNLPFRAQVYTFNYSTPRFDTWAAFPSHSGHTGTIITVQIYEQGSKDHRLDQLDARIDTEPDVHANAQY